MTSNILHLHKWRRRMSSKLSKNGAYEILVTHHIENHGYHNSQIHWHPHSGVPINSVAESTKADNFPALKPQKEAYQSLIGSIGWIAQSTCPDLITAHSFLSSYSNTPSTGHMTTLYTLHYIYSTHDCSISFISDNIGPMHSFIHYPPSTDVQAYNDTTPPKPTNSSTISFYSNACWGLQIGSTVADGTPLPLFKFRSISSGIMFKNGGPLGWLSKCQEGTALSSCKAKICATSATLKTVMDLRKICQSVANSGFPILILISLPLFTMTMKPASSGPTTWLLRWLGLLNCVRTPFANVKTRRYPPSMLPGKTNPADIFTKEMRDRV